jgi:hypothetical protein
LKDARNDDWWPIIFSTKRNHKAKY